MLNNLTARRRLGDAAIVALVLILDRLSKRWALVSLSGGPDAGRALVPGLLGLRLTRNTGVAFSALRGGGVALIALTALLIAALLIWYLRKPGAGAWFRVGASLAAAGGLGNLYDRVVSGSVIDFIEPLFVRFPIFNLADAAVVCGALCLIVAILRGEV